MASKHLANGRQSRRDVITRCTSTGAVPASQRPIVLLLRPQRRAAHSRDVRVDTRECFRAADRTVPVSFVERLPGEARPPLFWSAMLGSPLVSSSNACERFGALCTFGLQLPVAFGDAAQCRKGFAKSGPRPAYAPHPVADGRLTDAQRPSHAALRPVGSRGDPVNERSLSRGSNRAVQASGRIIIILMRSTSFDARRAGRGNDRRVTGRGRPTMAKEEAERVRKEANALFQQRKNEAAGKGERYSREQFAAEVGMSSTGAKFLLEGTTGPSEQTARRIAELRKLPDGFWRTTSLRRNVSKPATDRERVRWLANRLSLPEPDLQRLWSESLMRLANGAGEVEMKGIPSEVRDAALALVHLEDCTIEQALGAAAMVYEMVGRKADWTPRHWLDEIRPKLLERLRKQSGTRPSSRFKTAE